VSVAPPAPSQRAEPAIPQAREETATAALDGKLYVIAGYSAGGQDTDSVFVYAAGTWQAGPRLPLAVDHPSAAVSDGRLYVGGGFTASRASNQVFVLSGDGWSAVAPMRRARGALALVGLGGKLYALGGNATDGNVGIPEVFDPQANVWSDLPALPLPRNHVAGFAYRGMACVAGGRSPNTARVDCYEPGLGGWKRLPDLPEATSGAGSAVLDDRILVAGGESNVIIDQLARFDGTAWQRDRMLVPRHGLQLAVLDGRVWACAGGTAPGLHAVTNCTSMT